MGSLLGCSLAVLLLAGSGSTAQRVETVMQDDAVLLHRTDASVREAVAYMHDAGVDRVRITAGWSVLAPDSTSTLRPDFDAEDTRTYDQAHLRALDRAVRLVTQTGMDVQIDLAFWAPRWAVTQRTGSLHRSRHAPDPGEFAAFARAVARRYSGDFIDRQNGVGRLPAVRLYTTWNEPNWPYFLMPQWKRTRKGFRAYSPHLYRPMHELAYHAITGVDSRNQVLIGGLAAKGGRRRGRGGVRPLEFLRTLACVNKQLAPLDVRECRGVGPLHADGFAMHPYSHGVAPGVGAEHPDDVYLADLGRLRALISALHQRGRTDAEWPVYVTEYGYETRPPDPNAQYTPALQARYLGWATYIAHTEPGVRQFAQFLLRDIDTPDGRDFQTGLLYADGKEKPGARAFKLPFFASTSRAPDGSVGVVLYGGVRPGNDRRIVRVQRRDPATGEWRSVTTIGESCDEATGAFLTDGDGFFRRMAAWEGPAHYRLGWEHSGTIEWGPAVRVDEPSLID